MNLEIEFQDEYVELLRLSSNFEAGERREHREGQNYWGVWGSSMLEYSNDTFYKSLHIKNTNLINLLNQRKERSKRCAVLEICGNGSCLNELVVTHGMAITLNDFRNEQEKDIDLKRQRVIVEGNLLKDPWPTIRQKMNLIKITDFDFMLMAPYGGWSGLEPRFSDASVYFIYHYIQEAWKFLSPDSGMFLIKLPSDQSGFEDTKLRKWLGILDQGSNIDVYYPPGNELILTKNGNSIGLIEPNVLEEVLFSRAISTFV